MKSLLIRIKGQRAFQVAQDEVISESRKSKDTSRVPLCYLDPGYEYEVKEAFGIEMCRRYPADVERYGEPKKYGAPKAEEKAAKVEAPKSKTSKKG
jgi:hypothetical protein